MVIGKLADKHYNRPSNEIVSKRQQRAVSLFLHAKKVYSFYIEIYVVKLHSIESLI